jgi:tagatose 1,6-diphosphate aldolase
MNLSSIQTPQGFFTIAAFDHRGSLAEMFKMDLRTEIGAQTVTHLKMLFMEAFSDICSGVLVDPQYGFSAITHKAKNTGLILSLESSGYGDERTSVPTLIENWSVRHVKNNYGVAKLLAYFHPQEPNAAKKRQLIIELGEYCRHEDIAFLIEPVIFNPATGKEDLNKTEFQEAQLVTAQEFQKYCDVLKLQYPGDALACATLTAELDVPWILLSRGVTYDKFKDALKVCMENGAKGFAVGRAIWQDIGQFVLADGMPDYEAIRRFLQETGRERMKELIKIVVETVK